VGKSAAAISNSCLLHTLLTLHSPKVGYMKSPSLQRHVDICESTLY